MSQTKLSKEQVKKLLFISKKFKGLNTGNPTRNFWLVSYDDPTAGSYEWGNFDIGVNDSGELVTCDQGGCSCNSYEFPSEADTKYPLVGELIVEIKEEYVDEINKSLELKGTVDALYKLFKSGKYNVNDILKLRNAEIRRAVIEYIGLDKFLVKAKPKVLDDSSFGKLVKISIPKSEEWNTLEDEDIVAVFVKDVSTSRKYFLRVPPETKTAREAVAWTFGLSEEEYHPSEES